MILRAFLVWLCLAGLVQAQGSGQGFSGLARLDIGQSQVRDDGEGLSVTLHLSQVVPYRAFTLDDPRRLVLDFREVDWGRASRAALLNADRATDLRFGGLRPGWSRLVVDLAEPMVLSEAGMAVDDTSGTAVLRVVLIPATAEDYAEASGAPPDPDWDLLSGLNAVLPPAPQSDDRLMIVVIDPGHGGIDPGAERNGLVEAEVMLQLAQELAETLARSGDFQPVLTRTSDVFVPLAQRMTIARAAGADVFLSLHADALDEGMTRGASIYTLSEEAKDRASQRMAERHEQGDLLAGVDLTGQDDTVATILMDIARLQTGPQGDRLAAALVTGLRAAGARVNSSPRRSAPLAVLNAADFPSVLIEVGFLSNAGDRDRIGSVDGRATIVAGIVEALQLWRLDEAARAPLLRR